jgi:hypothetical protein
MCNPFSKGAFEMSSEQAEIRIYVACLASYNNGILHGAWIDAWQDETAVWDEINA